MSSRKQYRLIGYPLGHSISPQIHARLFELEGIEADFALLPVEPDTLSQHISKLMSLDGMNVTLPFKQTVLPYLDELHESAQLYDSVNAIQRRMDGSHIGYNTDCDGFLRTMELHQIRLSGRVCVLGAGGAGRMFVIESARQGADVTLCVRRTSLNKAQTLADETKRKCGRSVHIHALEDLEEPFDLLINATPVGMYPKKEMCPIPEQTILRMGAVFDCIYNPVETRLVRIAKTAGITAVGGLEMLVWQAVKAHEYWNNSHFCTTQIQAITAEMTDILRAKFP